MSNWKKLAAMIIAGATVLSAAATALADEDVKEYKFAYSFSGMDESNMRILTYVQNECERLNETGEYNIEFIYTDAQSQVDKQISDVETLIMQKPDVIGISAVDTIGCIPCLQAVKNAGIYVIDTRGCDTDSKDITYNGAGEAAISEKEVQVIKDYLEANPEEHLYIGGIYGLANQVEQLSRIQCVLDLAEEMPDRITILETQYCDWSTDRACSTVEDWMQRYPELNAVVAANDDMGLGACNALNAAGKTDCFVLAVNGDATAIQMIEEGTQNYTTIAMDMEKFSEYYVWICLELVDGTLQDDENVFDGEYIAPSDALMIVNADNVEEYKASLE